MIKSSGFRISPTEIEDAVSRSGMVMHVVAFGVDDELLGQAVEVVVTPLDGTRIEVEALLAFCRKTMPNYMIPKRVHVWPGDIPKTGSGKLDRPTILDAVRAA
jgi:acyl-CoA synthetase (AMP-forming)/AMP-acid ligase II